MKKGFLNVDGLLRKNGVPKVMGLALLCLVLFVTCTMLLPSCKAASTGTEKKAEAAAETATKDEKEDSDEKKYDVGEVLRFTASGDETDIVYSDSKYETTEGRIEIANYNDFTVKVYLNSKDDDMSYTLETGCKVGFSDLKKNTPYDVGIQCDQKKGTEVKIVVSDGEWLELNIVD